MKEFNGSTIGVIEPDMVAKSSTSTGHRVSWAGAPGFDLRPPLRPSTARSTAWRWHHWIRALLNGHDYDLGDFSYPIVACRHNKFEFPARDPSAINSTYNYAYHFDAHLYSKFLPRLR